MQKLWLKTQNFQHQSTNGTQNCINVSGLKLALIDLKKNKTVKEFIFALSGGLKVVQEQTLNIYSVSAQTGAHTIMKDVWLTFECAGCSFTLYTYLEGSGRPIFHNEEKYQHLHISVVTQVALYQDAELKSDCFEEESFSISLPLCWRSGSEISQEQWIGA